MIVKPCGNPRGDILICGEYPGKDEEASGEPFAGAAGWGFGDMLKEAGIDPKACYQTLALKSRPYQDDIENWISKRKRAQADEMIWGGKVIKDFVLNEIRALEAEIKGVRPKVIIAVGDIALWALTGNQSADKWRGSHLKLRPEFELPNVTVIPVIAPARVIKQHSMRFITVQDFRRVRRVLVDGAARPPMDYLIAPTYKQIYDWLNEVWKKLESGQKVRVVGDVEIKQREIICIGLGTSRTRAICIPFYKANAGLYWSPEEHTAVWEMIRIVLCHKNCDYCNQNLSFDIQYMFWRHFVWPRAAFDTMIAQNVLFPGTPKGLDYLASLYCPYYVYWKDDGKFWKEAIEDERLWVYNCQDCTYTYEVMEIQEEALRKGNLTAQMAEQTEILNKALIMMHRGVRVNKELKNALFMELQYVVEKMRYEAEWFATRELWADKGPSNKKIHDFFYREMRMPVVIDRKTKLPTCNDDALKGFAKSFPMLRPVVERINMFRSYSTAISACLSKVDADGRWRCSYNVAGTETFRFSSSENPLDSGLNLQNLTGGRMILEEDETK